MNKTKRGLYLGLITSITLLSTYLFIETYRTFDFLFNNLPLNITESVVIFEIFVFLITITGYVSFFFNWSLLKEDKAAENPELIDDSEVKYVTNVGWKYYVHMLFCSFIVGFGVFMLLKPLQETAPIEKFPEGIVMYLIMLLIIAFGIVLMRDGLQIKRYLKSRRS